MESTTLQGGLPYLRPRSMPAQLTGNRISVGQIHHSPGELADPSPPFQASGGRLQIYGTAGYYLEWPGWRALLGGEEGVRHPVDLRHPDGSPIHGQQAAWDLMLHDWQGELVLYGGVMTATGHHREARWPRDNWTRRVYAFRQQPGGHWKREKEPLFGFPIQRSWVGHSYGHHFLKDESGVTWIFHERVCDEGGRGRPHLTEIFARPMLSPYRAGETETRILGVGDPPFPSTRRTIGGYLVEGPRPERVMIRGKTLYLMGFSSGDFPTESYGINIAFSYRPLGPYIPLLEATGEGPDLMDVGRELRQRLQLAWGPARPCFFADPAGNWWVLFHAVSKAILPDRDYTRWPREPLHHFHRNLYLAPLHLDLGEAGVPRITVG